MKRLRPQGEHLPAVTIHGAAWLVPALQHGFADNALIVARSSKVKKSSRQLHRARILSRASNNNVNASRISRRDFARATCAAATVLLTSAIQSRPSSAVCGEPDPAFTHYLNWEERLATGPDNRQIHYRVVGNRKKEVKARKYPILYLGDPGVALAAGEPLELLGGTDRRVILADFLGVGDSTPLAADFGLSPKSAVALARDEAFAVLRAAGIAGTGGKSVQSIHIIATGFGLEVANAIITALADQDVFAKYNVKVASVAAEGWTLGKKGEELTFAALQGNRICAQEGAEGGSISVVRQVYNPPRASESTMAGALQSISQHVPTIALRTSDMKSLDSKVTSQPLFTDHEVVQTGRIAHLAGTQDVMATLEIFLEDVEKKANDAA